MGLIDTVQFWKRGSIKIDFQQQLNEKRRLAFNKNPTLALEMFSELEPVGQVLSTAQQTFNEVVSSKNKASIERNGLRAKAVAEQALGYFEKTGEVPVFIMDNEWRKSIQAEELLLRRKDLSDQVEQKLTLDQDFRYTCQEKYLKWSEAYFKDEKMALQEYPELAPLGTLKKQANKSYGQFVIPDYIQLTVRDCMNQAIKDIARGVPVQSTDELKLHAEYLNHSIIGMKQEKTSQSSKPGTYTHSADLIHLLIGRNGLQTGFWLPLTEKQFYDEPNRILNIEENINIEQRKAAFLTKSQEEALIKYPELSPIYHKHQAALNLYQQKVGKEEALLAAGMIIGDDFKKVINKQLMSAVSEYDPKTHDAMIIKASEHVKQYSKKSTSAESLAESINALTEIHNKNEEKRQTLIAHKSEKKASKETSRMTYAELVSTVKPLEIGHLFKSARMIIPNKQPDKDQIYNELKAATEPFIKQLLGEPNTERSSASEYRYGNKGSLSVTIQGEHQGMWHDFEKDQHGNLFQLIEREKNCSFVEALNNARDFLGYNNVSVSVPESKGVKDTTKWAKYLYTQAQPIKNTLAETYLKIYRGIPEIPTESCRFLPAVNNYESKKTFPAVVFFTKNHKNEVQGAQVIYLDSETGKKADLAVVKRSFGNIKGTFVPIQSGEGNTIAIAEGPETALSIAAANKNLTVFASLGGLTNFSKIAFEDMGVKIEGHPLILCADNDKDNKSTLEKIDKVAAALTNSCFNVFICKPEKSGQDFNDVLKEKGVDKVNKYLNDAYLYQMNRNVNQSVDLKKNTKEIVKRHDYEMEY
jgi:phage/plasmid primase-like uncharacterized protein